LAQKEKFSKAAERLQEEREWQSAVNYLNERLDHLGTVAWVCQELGWPTSCRRWSPTNSIWSVLAMIYLHSQERAYCHWTLRGRIRSLFAYLLFWI